MAMQQPTDYTTAEAYSEMRADLSEMVARFGARRVAEEYVELLWDLSDRIKKDKGESDTSVWRAWRTLATKLGNAVHWQGLAWPS